ncbi:MAG: PilZ domain-containing protein [Myxococcota bacterium]|nr:PilZ domain-containing protein [Myxococcota bacterium]
MPLVSPLPPAPEVWVPVPCPEVEGPLTAAGVPWRREAGSGPLPVAVGPAAAVSARCARPLGPVGVVIGDVSDPGAWAPGVDYWVRSPVDSAALLLLIRHLLARPCNERRLAERVALELPVRIRTGLRSRPAWIRELSAGGARVESDLRLRPGSRVEIGLPASGSGSRPCWIGARVLRAVHQGRSQGALAFTNLPLAAQERIRTLLRTARASEHAQTEAERRRSSRHAYPRRVIARGTHAPHVLLGLDLSMEGMRVEPGPDLQVGEELEIAVHVRAGQVPLVLRAKVARDDGPRGLFLRFTSLDDSGRRFLQAMVAELPSLESQRGSLVVSEVL